MKITAIEAIPLGIKIKPLKMATRVIDREECILVRVRTDEGLAGYGEAVTAPYFTGDWARSAKLLIDGLLGPALVGQDPCDPVACARLMERLVASNPATRAAVEIALYDVLGKALGVPLYRLLGGPRRDEVPALWHIGNFDARLDAEEAARAAERGFRMLKLKVGAMTHEQDLASLAAIRAAAPSLRIVLDANQAWTVDQAIRFIRAAEEHHVDFVESPIRGTDLAGMARVAAAVATPVAADEGLFSAEDALAHVRAGAAGVFVPKVIKAGGLGEVQRIAALAETANVGLHLAAMPGQTSVGAAADAHLGLALARLDYWSGIAVHYAEQDVVEERLLPRAGAYRPPDGPGLGVEVSEALLARCRLDG